MADVHIGAWRDPRLRDVSTECFCKAIDMSLAENVDFILISGDLFNTSLPSIEHLRIVVTTLKKVKDKGVPVYYIAGSHDFSTSGKTMLDVLQAAGLAENIAKGEEVNGKLQLKFTEDKTGVKIAGMVGKKGGLETAYYDNLDYAHLENEPGEKVFLFHSAIEELKPAHLEQMPAAPLSILPKGFDYYAGGHVHVIEEMSFDNHKNVVFPGPMFPCSFSELEHLPSGGFYIVEDWKTRYVPVELYPIKNYKFDCEHKTPAQVEEMLMEILKDEDMSRTIVTLRLKGQIQGGKVSDIRYQDVIRTCYRKGAKSVLRNTYKLTSAEMEAVKVDMGSVEDVEEKLIKENIGQQQVFSPEVEEKMIKNLMHALSVEKEEGETVAIFEKRLQEEVDVLFTD